jgi:hypothetical protein
MSDTNSVKRYELDQHARFDGASDHAAMALSGNGDWVSFQDYKEQADRIEELEAKLAKCEALMHAGLAEYQRRLVMALEALDALADCVDDGCHRSEMRMATAMDHARTVLEELEGERDD